MGAESPVRTPGGDASKRAVRYSIERSRTAPIRRSCPGVGTRDGARGPPSGTVDEPVGGRDAESRKKQGGQKLPHLAESDASAPYTRDMASSVGLVNERRGM